MALATAAAVATITGLSSLSYCSAAADSVADAGADVEEKDAAVKNPAAK